MFEGQPKGLYALALANTGHDVNNLCQFPGRSVFHAADRRYSG